MVTRHFLKKFKATLAVSNRRAKGLGSWGRAGDWKRRHDLLHLLFTALRAIRKQPLIASSKLSFSSFIPIISPWLFRVSCASHPHEGGKNKPGMSTAARSPGWWEWGQDSWAHLWNSFFKFPKLLRKWSTWTFWCCISTWERVVEFT